MTRRVTIDRLELKLRGVAPRTAEAAARLLGGEIARALREAGAQGRGAIGGLDAGRIETTPRADAATLAQQIGARIARRIGEGRS